MNSERAQQSEHDVRLIFWQKLLPLVPFEIQVFFVLVRELVF